MSDDEPVNLAARRADKSGDSRDWSVADALREALRLVESGELNATMVYVALQVEPDASDPNSVEHVWKCAGGTKIEYLGLLVRHTHLICSGT